MEFRFVNNALKSLVDDVQDAERCGVIYGRYEEGVLCVYGMRELPNRSEDTIEGFAIRASDVRSLKRSLYAPLGYWHTHMPWHPADPSGADIDGMAKYPRHIGLVLHPATRTATLFNYKGVINNMKVSDNAR